MCAHTHTYTRTPVMADTHRQYAAEKGIEATAYVVLSALVTSPPRPTRARLCAAPDSVSDCRGALRVSTAGEASRHVSRAGEAAY